MKLIAPFAAVAPLRVVIAYSGAAAGHRAVHLLTEEIVRVRNSPELSPTLWRFDRFGDPGWRRQATDEALAADLVIVATEPHHGLPAGVNAWFAEVATSRARQELPLVLSWGAGDTWSIILRSAEGGERPNASQPLAAA